MSIHKQYATQVFQQQLEQYPPAPEHQTGDKEEKRQPPPPPVGLSRRDQEVLLAVRKGYRFLDESFHIFGIYFGWGFIFAFCIPFFGAAIDFALSYTLIIRKAEKTDMPGWLRSEMTHNLLLGIALSLIPFVGRIISALYGPNSRNVQLFEEFMRIRADEYVKLGGSGALVQEKPEDDGWWKVLSAKAGGTTGISKNDVEQIKPGAGMTAEEVQQVSVDPKV